MPSYLPMQPADLPLYGGPVETLPETAVEEMRAGEWDLTLFTCTYDGRAE